MVRTKKMRRSDPNGNVLNDGNDGTINMDIDGTVQEEKKGEETTPIPNGTHSNGMREIVKHNPIGRPAEAGIITRVQVENFMCHRKLTVNLCRNVNFIHGQNGSGKFY